MPDILDLNFRLPSKEEFKRMTPEQKEELYRRHHSFTSTIGQREATSNPTPNPNSQLNTIVQQRAEDRARRRENRINNPSRGTIVNSEDRNVLEGRGIPSDVIEQLINGTSKEVSKEKVEILKNQERFKNMTTLERMIEDRFGNI